MAIDPSVWGDYQDVHAEAMRDYYDNPPEPDWDAVDAAREPAQQHSSTTPLPFLTDDDFRS